MRLLAILPLIGFSLWSQERQLIDRIVAVVDDEIILQSEVQQYAYFEAVNQKIDLEKDKTAYEALEKRILENLINQKILLAQAKVDSIVVEESQVDQALNQQIQQRIDQAGGEEALEKILGKKISELRRFYRNDVRKQLLTQQIQSTRFNGVKVSRSDVEQFYATYKDSLPKVGESVNLSHVLLEVKPGESAYREARALAQSLLDSIRRKGGNFDELAKAFSSDPGSARKGGDLGWFNRSDFVKEYADAAVRLEEGQISDLVKTQFGYHIIQLLGRSGDKIHTKHILIGVKTTQEDNDRTLQRIRDIRQDILDNKVSFENAAVQYSDDPAKKGNLGNLGWIEISSLQDKAFLLAAQSLEKNAISEPVESSLVTGYHVIRLNDRRKERILTLKEDWQTIENYALNQKQNKEMSKWLDEIRSRFFVDIRM
jgi:peptidyl-prolyl cis-trans isomerase SurA